MIVLSKRERTCGGEEEEEEDEEDLEVEEEAGESREVATVESLVDVFPKANRWMSETTIAK